MRRRRRRQSRRRHRHRHRRFCRCCGVVGLLAECVFYVTIGKNIGQQYCWCSLMWLIPLRSLSNCDYELKNLPTVFCGSQAGGNVHKISLPLLKFRKNVTIRQVKFRQKFPSRLPHLSRPQPVRNGQ